jgi:hypothetical protein
MSNSSSFSQFTNLYSLSKTLRFELKPVGKTKQMLEENNIFKTDEIIQNKYKKTKTYLDRLHREFAKESLSNARLDGLKEYEQALKNVKKITRDTVKKQADQWKKELENLEKKLRKQIIVFFNRQAKQWSEKYIGLKNNDMKILEEEHVFESLLKEKYGKEDDAFIKDEKNQFILDESGDKISIFDSWKGFTGYFTKFFETRKNFYKDDGTSTALATRIIDQNLKRFCDNLLVFENIKEKLDFSEIAQNFGKNVEDVFTLDFYNKCLLQDGINFYNKILGGDVLLNGQKQKGVNEIINKYRQDNKGEKLPFLKLLDKQILSELEKEKFIDEIENDEQLQKILKIFQKTAKNKIKFLKKLLFDFIKNYQNYDLTKIYISKEAFNTISYKWTNETNLFQKTLYETMKEDKTLKGLKYEKRDDAYKFPDFIAFSFIYDTLKKIKEEKFWKERYSEIAEFERKVKFEQFLGILNFEFLSLFEKEVTNSKTGETNKIGYNDICPKFIALVENFENTKQSKVLIKEFADSVLHIYQMAKYFAIEKKRKWLDDYDLDDFYTNPDFGYQLFYENAYEDIVQIYNKLRNYLTKKPYDEKKWKLNFKNPTLANGWDKNKESDNFAILLRKEGSYYLGLMRKGHNKIFSDKDIENFKQNTQSEKYEKMEYKYFPDQAKMFPKVCFSKKGLEFFQPSEEIYNIYKNEEFKKGDSFSVKSMQKLINFYKNSLTKYVGWQCFNFKHLKPTQEYTNNIGEFYHDVAKNGYKISFKNISKSYIDEKNQNGELYLFEIHNKDWNVGATGKKNLHTMYFESLFSNENIAKNFSFKLNGQAEIFYRPKTDIDKLGSKKDKQGKIVTNHKRYGENKIFFHIPISVNRTKNDAIHFNEKMNDFLANNPEINIIGVDRGEKHLAYYSVINQKQEILESGTLNLIQNKNESGEVILKKEKEILEIRNDNNEIIDYKLIETGKKTKSENYKLLLDYKEKKRKIERQSWQAVENIKDLKQGYVSQVIRKLADLVIKYNAIIVFEDLNMRFKQIRGGIEKSAYQQLEKALIEKLNFLVEKGEINSQKAGHLLKAYQLTAPFKTFQKMGKQTGILFYTQANYTSKIDPVTGWRPNLYLKYSNAEQAKKDISKFSTIKFANGRFEFSYNVGNFKKLKEIPKNTLWTVCSQVERFRWDRYLNQNKGGYNHYENLTTNFKELLENFMIDIKGDIKKQIENLDASKNDNKVFFKKFIFLFQLICQIRNTNPNETGNDNDFILSPVFPFFDSRKNNGAHLPKNGDDNGAYNIARKGIIVLNKISDYVKKNENSQKMKWNDLFVSSVDWDNFIFKNV